VRVGLHQPGGVGVSDLGGPGGHHVQEVDVVEIDDEGVGDLDEQGGQRVGGDHGGRPPLVSRQCRSGEAEATTTSDTLDYGSSLRVPATTSRATSASGVANSCCGSSVLGSDGVGGTPDAQHNETDWTVVADQPRVPRCGGSAGCLGCER
jgi:hypothetical protein